ncbi:hypothetical protein [Celeribacter halophilus]|uniref:Uncharacterized protein n=1 Tax=Celeribacter halophilus TaxID=576117 RepID=A0A1I3U6H0_9RHOB|nr:hypothetical protein [Celeribacter halophilus]PZX10172.1 hypothetical protein LX82_02446 [Celeribacter halophilus]SFJ77387.1 hypothetical protein SAMN04488138_11030 [Celeribacter halophilus]
MFAICSFMDMKRKLGNVSFGGNWSEDILTSDQLNSVLDFLDAVAARCADEDMRGDRLEDALVYVSVHIEKGDMLAAAMRNGLAMYNPWQRQEAVCRAVRLI